MTIIKARDVHQRFNQELIALLRKYTGELTAEEVLAIVSQLLGKVAAMQDCRTATAEKVMQTIMNNIEIGNHEAVEELLGEPGGRA
jgi:hypothetical protein